MGHYLAKMVELFFERSGDSMMMLCEPGKLSEAQKSASDYIYSTVISRLGDLKAKASVMSENDERVVRGTGHDGFEFVHDDGTRGRFLSISSEDKTLDFYEAADLDILTETVDEMIEAIWLSVKDYVTDGKLWFLTTPKLWFQFRAGRVEFRVWCVVAE